MRGRRRAAISSTGWGARPASSIEEYYWRWFVFGRLGELVSPAPAHLPAGAWISHLIVDLGIMGLGHRVLSMASHA
jgi:hypothetical protein